MNNYTVLNKHTCRIECIGMKKATLDYLKNYYPRATLNIEFQHHWVRRSWPEDTVVLTGLQKELRKGRRRNEKPLV